ncbi:TolB, C-terminal domain-containing protein [Aaosphaeria arxii CBS 175.79]|uniref:TolB, C-terminal domain-containing protein n=1 Tax=Aaosphaeria arxii CBS 175.79 TaxID=1450172 RepID=A0A6A5XDC3_9PLEO|nr:TolB, C-terminal domain-containing protein [Aaosphaeria arxii CBS 175.79]KAF2010998.1 TolB, C-terminal domain-containing protein [Aaosphaeria arxii CBS 175.79]
MENLEVSQQFKASQYLPSPTAAHLACITGTRLQIRCVASNEVIRNIALPASLDVRNARLAWSPPSTSPRPDNPTSSSAAATPPRTRRRTAPRSNRILVAAEETTRVYDLRDQKWSATISNGSGGMGKNVHAVFGGTEDEVVIWSDFASKATVWCLRTGRTVEIKDPKFSGREGKGWGYRPCGAESSETGTVDVRRDGRVLAMLCRSAGQDVLLILDGVKYQVVKRVDLPTVDAVGLKWSLDGRWIAVWDSAASGFQLHVYTADGHLYKTVGREPSDRLSDWTVEGLGIKSVEWVPGNQWLAVGGWDRRVRILSTRTFAPVVFLDHTAQINVPSAAVYTEEVDARGNRRYSLTQQPVEPPKAVTEKNDTGAMKQGISLLAFNMDGTICATRDDATPTTIWIWDLRSLRPSMILIQHSPVKSLQWHPTDPSLLLIQTTQDTPTLYLWRAPSLQSSTFGASTSSSRTPMEPTIITLKDHITKCAGSVPARWDAKWLPTTPDKKTSIVLGHQQGCILLWPDGKDQILRFESVEGDDSDDSLYDILTGRTPIPPLHQSAREDDDMDDENGDSAENLEDTFRDKRLPVGSGGRGQEYEVEQKSIFYESGMDEMF